VPRIDLIDETFVVAPATRVAEQIRNPRCWRSWWPDLRLTTYQDRADAGVRWNVTGALVGSMEVWIEPWGDGVILHYYLRADPVGPRQQRSDRDEVRARAIRAKEIFWRLKDDLEGDRPPGCGRAGYGASMPDQSTQSITIEATPGRIMDVIADFPAYPEWAGAVQRCEVLDAAADGRARQVRFLLDAGVVKDDYVLEYDWAADDSRVDWHLVRGQMQKSQTGSYELRQQGDSTEVTYTLAVDLSIPMLGMFKRKAEKVIMDTALRELKKRVEG